MIDLSGLATERYGLALDGQSLHAHLSVNTDKLINITDLVDFIVALIRLRVNWASVYLRSISYDRSDVHNPQGIVSSHGLKLQGYPDIQIQLGK